MTTGRIRVLIAGDISVKRVLARRFLEDDGYEVVGESQTLEETTRALARTETDAVVLDDTLVAGQPGGGSLDAIRAAAPDARIIVVTAVPPGQTESVPGADAYLERGVGLGTLSALLGRLFLSEPVAMAALGATTGTSAGPRSGAPGGASRAMPRLVAMAVGGTLIVWGFVAMLTSGGGAPVPRPLDRTDTTDQDTIVAAPTTESLERAYESLDELVAAIDSGNYVLATVQAQALMDQREQARSAGFAIAGLDAEVLARLEALVAGVPGRVDASLSAILGALYPTLPAEPGPGGGGGGIVVAGGGTAGTVPTQPAADGGTGGTGGADGTDGTGGTTPGGAGGSADGGGRGGDTGGDQVGDGGPGQGGSRGVGPGDGRAWGQSHRPPSGGWHGENPKRNGHGTGSKHHGKPPWANGPK